MTKLPVDFVERAKVTAQSNGYPTQISASDLMANFNFATLSAPEVLNGARQPFSVQEKALSATQKQRVLAFSPPPPDDGKTYVFAFSAGEFRWLSTEEC